jgi:hypothetical protein
MEVDVGDDLRGGGTIVEEEVDAVAAERRCPERGCAALGDDERWRPYALFAAGSIAIPDSADRPVGRARAPEATSRNRASLKARNV